MKKRSPWRWLYYVYSVFMLIAYLGYVIVMNDRMQKVEMWVASNPISRETADMIRQSWMWQSIFETAFLMMFFVMCIVCYIYIRVKNNRKVLKPFLACHGLLFLGIGIFSIILVRITPLAIGNLLQPLFIPVFLLEILLFVVLIKYLYSNLIERFRAV